MTCPKCGSENCSVITDTTTYSKGYDLCNGLIGSIIMGPIGMLCGLCGMGQNTVSTDYWVCNFCGYKWEK